MVEAWSKVLETTKKVTKNKACDNLKIVFIQVCLRFEDVEFSMDVRLEDGRVMRSGSFAGKMRRYLMREHLGMSLPGERGSRERNTSSGSVADCVSDSFYKRWNHVAETNTKVTIHG